MNNVVDERCRESVLRIIQVWRDRNIYKPIDLNKLEKHFVSDGSSYQKPSSSGSLPKIETGKKVFE